jgi:exosortase A-associated hydrolase 2
MSKRDLVHVTETPFYFSRRGSRLFGLLHQPAQGQADVGVVMSHPFGEEKLWSHRVFVVFARTLAARGVPVLRFDYTGAGDSEGDTGQVDVDTWLDDLGAAVAALGERAPGATRIGLVGLRFGATLAAAFAERARARGDSPAVLAAPLVLWDPVLDGEAYIQELLRINLSTQLAVYGKVRESREQMVERIRAGGTANVEGYEIGQGLLDSATTRAAELRSTGLRHAGGTLVMQIAANDKQKPREDLQQFAQASQDAVFDRAIEQPFWREIKPFVSRAEDLQNRTLAWLESRHV